MKRAKQFDTPGQTKERKKGSNLDLFFSFFRNNLFGEPQEQVLNSLHCLSRPPHFGKTKWMR